MYHAPHLTLLFSHFSNCICGGHSDCVVICMPEQDTVQFFPHLYFEFPLRIGACFYGSTYIHAPTHPLICEFSICLPSGYTVLPMWWISIQTPHACSRWGLLQLSLSLWELNPSKVSRTDILLHVCWCVTRLKQRARSLWSTTEALVVNQWTVRSKLTSKMPMSIFNSPLLSPVHSLVILNLKGEINSHYLQSLSLFLRCAGDGSYISYKGQKKPAIQTGCFKEKLQCAVLAFL